MKKRPKTLPRGACPLLTGLRDRLLAFRTRSVHTLVRWVASGAAMQGPVFKEIGAEGQVRWAVAAKREEESPRAQRFPMYA